tara:strand:- start:379 stop:1557 length:1179 start_codon:yes stop_codon:yes gene_type:complete
MSSFAYTQKPTPFSFFDTDTDFQQEADAMVTFVKRKLGDDILSVELTKKQIWACFEESFLEYGRIINEADAKSQLNNLLGYSTGSNKTGLFPRQNLEFLLRMAEPYSMEAGIGGSYNEVSGSITLEYKRQDYNIYNELKDADGNLIVSSSKNSPRTKMRIKEVFHFSPQAAYRFFDTTSAVNYLNNEFSFESFTPETMFYVLPVFEDVLRAGQMDISNRVRKSNYSYRVIGENIRIYPMPTVLTGSTGTAQKLWIRVAFNPDPYNPDVEDDTIYGVSNMSNVPFGRMKFNKTNSVGRQWVREYTLALSKELLGQVRSKFASVPIPSGDLNLNGTDLVSQGREDQTRLRDQLIELLDSLTYSKLLEGQATDAENIMRTLKAMPMPLGKCILIK